MRDERTKKEQEKLSLRINVLNNNRKLSVMELLYVNNRMNFDEIYSIVGYGTGTEEFKYDMNDLVKSEFVKEFKENVYKLTVEGKNIMEYMRFFDCTEKNEN